MHLPDIPLPLCVSSGFLCESLLYSCQTLSWCVCYNEHTSVHSVMLSSRTVNVFCSVPFWSEIKILSWPENLHNDQFWQFESAVFDLFLKGAAGFPLLGLNFSWYRSVGRVQYPATLCSCSCYCTCGGSSLMHWCTWSLDACSPIKINVIKPVARLSMWPTHFEGVPSVWTTDSRKGVKIRLRRDRDFNPHSVTSDQMWWSWWCSICPIERALVTWRRGTHHFPSRRPAMQTGDGELWAQTPQALLKTSREAALGNLKPSATARKICRNISGENCWKRCVRSTTDESHPSVIQQRRETQFEDVRRSKTIKSTLVTNPSAMRGSFIKKNKRKNWLRWDFNKVNMSFSCSWVKNKIQPDQRSAWWSIASLV